MAKKITEATGQVRITCPACKSEISSDGSALHKRSEYLDALIETDAGVDELEKTIGQLESKLSAAKEELRKAAQKEEAASAPKNKTEVKENVGAKQNGGDKPTGRGREWW